MTYQELIDHIQKTSKYTCLTCGNTGKPIDMTCEVVVGNKVKVKAIVCKECNDAQ